LPEAAVPLYDYVTAALSDGLGRPVPTGRFGEHMVIDARNDGPVTLVVDARDRDFQRLVQKVFHKLRRIGDGRPVRWVS